MTPKSVGLPLSMSGQGVEGIMFGNGNLFPGNTFPFPNFDVWKRKRVSLKQVSVARNENGFSVSTVLCCNGRTPENMSSLSLQPFTHSLLT